MKHFSDERYDGMNDLLLAIDHEIDGGDRGQMGFFDDGMPLDQRSLRQALLRQLLAPTQSQVIKSLQLDR